MRLPPLLAAIRPHQWAKNLVVLAAPMTSPAAANPETLARAAITVGLFCGASSAGYLANDLADRCRDRLHPTKRARPVASGVVSVPLARGFALALALSALTLGAWLDTGVALVVGCYLVGSLTYSRFLKMIPVVDVGLISLLFVARLVAGAAATGVRPNAWLVVAVFSGAALVALGKRTQEAASLGPIAAQHRPVLRWYSVRDVERIRVPFEVALVSSVALAWTAGVGPVPGIIVAATALLVERRWRRLRWNSEAADPARVLLADPAVLSALACIGGVTAIGVYAG